MFNKGVKYCVKEVEWLLEEKADGTKIVDDKWRILMTKITTMKATDMGKFSCLHNIYVRIKIRLQLLVNIILKFCQSLWRMVL